MELSDLFDKVGGRREAEKLCGIQKWSSYKWGSSVPSKHWATFAKEAHLTLEQVSAIGRKRGDAA